MTPHRYPQCLAARERPCLPLTAVFQINLSTYMKRKIASKFAGTSAKGNQYYAIRFAPALSGSVLLLEKVVFVNEDIYNLVEEGQELEVES